MMRNNYANLKIDETQLLRDIEAVESEVCYENYSVYLFMSEKTLNAFEAIYNQNFKAWCDERKGLKSYYTGRRIFINNDLPLGDIEIR